MREKGGVGGGDEGRAVGGRECNILLESEGFFRDGSGSGIAVALSSGGLELNDERRRWGGNVGVESARRNGHSGKEGAEAEKLHL